MYNMLAHTHTKKKNRAVGATVASTAMAVQVLISYHVLCCHSQEAHAHFKVQTHEGFLLGLFQWALCSNVPFGTILPQEPKPT